ncbi:MAG TPA: fasciclin domain-containing protein [Puia sp.]|nr:fasciclin domain-containing protein [Puia sp.]
MSNITQLVNVEKNMTTLKKGVHASGLDQVLSGKGPYTVFAPTDIAFAKLDKGVLDNLLKPENKTKLADLLNHHVVEGKVNFKDLKDGEKLKTVNGKQLVVHIKDGHTTVDGAVILSHDVQATNGIIHSLETVMFKN